MPWTNSDGLRINMGVEEATLNKAGEYPDTVGNTRIVEVKITPTALGANPTILDNFVSIPKNARIERVVVVANTAVTSGGAAVLNVGLRALDATTAIDEDGFVAALALASINAAGKTVDLTVGSTSAGALIGTTLSQAGLLFADYDTAAYTGGDLSVRVHFRIL